MRAEPCAATESEDDLRVWQLGNGDARTFPEAAPEVGLFNRTMDVGIAFCGGGSRAYSAALGALRVLASKGVMQNVRYVSGISGGSWAASVYSYWQQQAGTGASECQFLREYVPPSKLTDRALHAMRPDEMGAGAVNAFLPPLLAGAADLYLDTESIWQAAVAATYFTPFGLGAHDALFAYDAAHVEEVVARNPSLANRTFFTQRADRPYMVIHSTMLAPTEVVSPTEQALMENGPNEPVTRLFQWTPLYSGVALPPKGPITYTGATDNNGSWVPASTAQATIGGLFETFGLGSKTPAKPIEAFSPTATGATREATTEVCVHNTQTAPTIEAPLRYAPTSLAYAASSSSAWASATADYVVANNNPPSMATVITGMVMKITRTAEYQTCMLAGGNANTCLQSIVQTMDVWPAVKEPADLVSDFTFTDGGVADISGIVSLIQRNVAQVVAIMSTEQPFAYDASYDNASYVPTGQEIGGVGQFYGYLDTAAADSLFKDGQAKYLALLRGFNALAKEGKALVFTAPLVTIANAKYDVLADVNVTLTWVYPSPATAFSGLLPTDVQAELAKSTTDPQSAYYKFPNYATEFANCPKLSAWMAQAASGDVLGVLSEFLASDCDVESLTSRQVNLLAGFTGWAIDSHWDTLASVFTDDAHPTLEQEGCTAVLADDNGVKATMLSPSIFA